MTTRLTEFQRNVLRRTAEADDSETSLRRWFELAVHTGCADQIAMKLNARMDELAERALGGSSSADDAVDYTIAIAASVMFNQIQRSIVFGQKEGGEG
jgi:hypothetical protein